MLVDFVPYERKSEMILGFEKLFSLPSTGTRISSIKDQIMDITESGLAGFKANLGNIHNARKFYTMPLAIPDPDRFIIDSGGVKAELPDEIDRIEVLVGQDVDFCYYTNYFCFINKDHWNINRDTYIHSGDIISYPDNRGFNSRGIKGPRSDPTFQNYENCVAKFLSKYANGLFLKDYSPDTFVPSIRVLSTPSVEFSNLEVWGDKYWLYLEFLGMSRFYNRFQASILSLQTERIYEKSNVSKGITILYSEKDIPDSSDKYNRILSNASVLNDAIKDYFLPLYWASYNIFNPLEEWKTRLKDKRSQKFKSLAPEELEDKVTEVINLNGEFAKYNIDEKVNIRTARKTFNINKRLKGPPSITVYLYDLEMFKRLSGFIEDTLNEEGILIDDIQKQIDPLISYYRDMSNLRVSVSNLQLQESNIKLQKSLNWFSAKIAIIIAGVSIAASIIVQVLLG